MAKIGRCGLQPWLPCDANEIRMYRHGAGLCLFGRGWPKFIAGAVNAPNQPQRKLTPAPTAPAQRKQLPPQPVSAKPGAGLHEDMQQDLQRVQQNFTTAISPEEAYVRFITACNSGDSAQVADLFAPHMREYLEKKPGRSVQQDTQGAISACGSSALLHAQSCKSEPCAEDPNLKVFSVDAEVGGCSGVIRCNGTYFDQYGLMDGGRGWPKFYPSASIPGARPTLIYKPAEWVTVRCKLDVQNTNFDLSSSEEYLIVTPTLSSMERDGTPR